MKNEYYLINQYRTRNEAVKARMPYEETVKSTATRWDNDDMPYKIVIYTNIMKTDKRYF